MKGTLTFKGVAAGFMGIAIFLCLVFSCQTKQAEPTGKILSKEEMVRALTGLYLTEERINRLALPSDSSAGVFNIMETKLFEKLDMSDSVFRKSLDYYTDRPEELELIYTALVDSLQLQEQRATIAQPK